MSLMLFAKHTKQSRIAVLERLEALNRQKFLKKTKLGKGRGSYTIFEPNWAKITKYFLDSMILYQPRKSKEPETRTLSFFATKEDHKNMNKLVEAWFLAIFGMEGDDNSIDIAIEQGYDSFNGVMHIFWEQFLEEQERIEKVFSELTHLYHTIRQFKPMTTMVVALEELEERGGKR
jgi:hypothetical protein